MGILYHLLGITFMVFALKYSDINTLFLLSAVAKEALDNDECPINEHLISFKQTKI
jgi:hypothetical protein